MAFSDFQRVALSSSDGKYAVSFIKTYANLPETKQYRDNTKPGGLQNTERKDELLDQSYLNLDRGRWVQEQ